LAILNKRFGGKMKKIYLLLVILSLIINIFAYSLFEHQQGNYIHSLSARANALGTSGVAGGHSLFDSSLNPANISFLEKKLNADFTLNFVKNEEDRSIPLYNFFDSYIDNATYSNNSNIFTNTGVGASYGFDGGQLSFAAGLMIRPLVDFSSKYEEQVRNDASSDADTYPPIIAKNYIKGEGTINAYSILLSSAYDINEVNKLALGLEIALLDGSQKQTQRIDWTDFAHNVVGQGVLQDSLYKAKTDYKGLMFKLGANYKMSRRVNLGFAYQPKVKLDMTGKSTIEYGNVYPEIEIDDDYIIPTSIRWGLTYLPRNPYKTTFQMDMEYNKYSEINKFYDDTYAIFVGVEHYVGRAMPLRLGFKHEQSFGDAEIGNISMPTVSAGTAFPIAKNLVLNISGEFSTRTYECLDLFHDSFYDHNGLWRTIKPKDRGWENPDKVEEQFFKVQTNLSYTW